FPTRRSSDLPNLVCGPVQICWEKFARYFDVELRRVPLEQGATGLRPHQLRGHVDENTYWCTLGRAGLLRRETLRQGRRVTQRTRVRRTFRWHVPGAPQSGSPGRE